MNGWRQSSANICSADTRVIFTERWPSANLSSASASDISNSVSRTPTLKATSALETMLDIGNGFGADAHYHPRRSKHMGANREEYRQGNAMGPTFRHWRRAKIGRRFRLFFRFDSSAKIIIFAWVNDQSTLRSSGSKSDLSAVFQKMLQRGYPPDDWVALVSASKAEWKCDGLTGWSARTERAPCARVARELGPSI